ncbi:hypothetical protein MSG28_000332 [Choristoneura fumiferana]|uniref:Uncharacterized protein n=1 Tax=Choristoneura fumiferana TaxID=7141 RepID=A0ACC0K0T5_CHOFU|nr:hypothetical protein MSG28_000332 [Choristoneura fumiferana]
MDHAQCRAPKIKSVQLFSINLSSPRITESKEFGHKFGPALRMWYGLLQRYIGTQGKTVAIKKVFVDQFIFAPTFLVMILAAVGTMQGKPWKAVESDIEANYFDRQLPATLPSPSAACARRARAALLQALLLAHHAVTNSFTDLGLHDKKICTGNDSFTDHGIHDKHIKGMQYRDRFQKFSFPVLE